MIKGGYVLKPRKIKGSDISDASPCVRETWDYLIREANHKDFERGKFKIKRGQLFRSYDDIIDDLCWFVGWRKETYTKNQMKQAMKSLRDTERITTQKKPGGVLITVCNYSFYQDPSNYEETKEETDEETIEKPSTNHEQTSHNYKNEKNVKNDNKTLLSDLSSDEFNAMGDIDEKINWTTVRLHEKFRDRFGHYKTIKKATLEDWRDPIRLMHSEDGLEFKHIWSLIKHATTNDFWKDTVRSTSGLRNNWEELDANMRKESSKKNKQGKSEQANASAYVNDYTST